MEIGPTEFPDYIRSMHRSFQATGSRTAIRMCVSCGSCVLEHEVYQSCDSCGCAFKDRPPKTYEEMEGFNCARPAEEPAEPGTYEAWREQRLVERWLWFIFAAGLVVTTMLFIARA